MRNNFLCDKDGSSMLLTGLQAHNSSTDSFLIDKAIKAVKAIEGNTLEAPAYWYKLEPEEGAFDTTHVKTLIKKARAAQLKLIILWFASNKNGHPNYVPEYIKLNPGKYKLAIGRDGAPVASLSPHCEATMLADQRAFKELMKAIKEEDEDDKTVIAVQVENETGLANTDRDYSADADLDFSKLVPEELEGVEIEDSEASLEDNSWRGRFGRYAHEVFTAWHHARYVEQIAAAGRKVYDIPLLVNAMLGNTFAEGGITYNSGGPVERVLDIWKAGAPTIDLLCPDIYISSRDEYERICSSYSREDNPLFIPETIFRGSAAAINAIRAVAKYGAIGICGFGAESYLDDEDELTEETKIMADTVKAINNISPLLIKYHGTDNVHAIIQEEFAQSQYIQLPEYHIVANFGVRRSTGSSNDTRGRGILIQTDKHEFYLAGSNVGLNFIKRPNAEEKDPFPVITTRQSTQLNFLSVEEGHFKDGEWKVDFYRNGDESNFELYARQGQLVRIRLNP